MVRPQHGFTTQEFYWVIGLFGVFIIVFSQRVLYYQEVAEKAHMDLIVNQLRAAVRTRTAEYMLEDRMQELPKMLAENPMHWLEKKPDDYHGESIEFQRPGTWAYDSKNRQLIYKVRRSYFFKNRSQEDRIAWQVRLVIPAEKQSEMANNVYKNVLMPGQLGVDLILLTPYQWF